MKLGDFQSGHRAIEVSLDPLLGPSPQREVRTHRGGLSIAKGSIRFQYTFPNIQSLRGKLRRHPWASSSMSSSAPTPGTTTSPPRHERKDIAMHQYAPAAPNQPTERKSSSNLFQRRLAICLVQTVFNTIIVARYAGTLYGATNHEPLKQVGVTLLFAALLGSLARMWFLTLKSQTR